MTVKADSASSGAPNGKRAQSATGTAESAWQKLTSDDGTLARSAYLLARLDAARTEREILREDRATSLREARARLEELRQAVVTVGASLRMSGVPPERLVTQLRESLHIRHADEELTVPAQLAAQAITWGIEGYYAADAV